MNPEIEQIAKDVVDASMKIHIKLGPGLLEIVYEVVLARELQRRGYEVERQRPVPIRYEDITFDEGFRADLIVNDCFLVELKSIEKLAPVHSNRFLPISACSIFGSVSSSISGKRCSNKESSVSRTERRSQESLQGKRSAPEADNSPELLLRVFVPLCETL
jgi:GxxExxY protein